MSYMNESAWPGPDAAGNEAEDSLVYQADDRDLWWCYQIG